LTEGARYAPEAQPTYLGLFLALVDVSAMLAAFVAACIGLSRETSREFAVVGLLLSIVSCISLLSG